MSIKKGYKMGGNVPTYNCTFTDDRKLYLFPGLPKR